jgi:hypothetical protein
MAGNTLIVVLAAALVLAVGVLLFGVGRVLYGIAHYYLRERKPTREVRHPTYGLLTGEGGLWSGIARPNGREVRFTVGGTDSAPDDALLQRVGLIVGTFAEVERRAVDYLRAQEADVSKAAFEVYGLDVTDENHPDDFTLEFVADGDDSGSWRVEFEAGQPKRTGFDD